MTRHVDIDRDEFQSVGDAVGNLIDGLRNERFYRGGAIVEPGVYAGVPIETYHRDTNLFDGFSVSSSGIRALLRRPLEYWWTSPYNPDAEKPDSKPALDFGKAAHMLLLGEHGFAERYVLRPAEIDDKPWQSNRTACKQWLAEQDKAGRTVITDTEIGHIKYMAAALQQKEAVRLGLLNGRVERSIFTTRGKMIWLKSRPDVIPNDSGDFVDLKTAAAVDDESLSRAIFAHGYHIQAGFTRMVVRDVLGKDAFTSFTFAFVEKQPPYDVRIVQMRDGDIDLGERQAMQGLRILAECIKRGAWPGYDGHDQHISFVDMPAWARTRIDTQLNAEAA